MPTRPRTGFDLHMEQQLRDPEFRHAYEKERQEIDAVDALVRALDATREEKGISKAELARRLGMKPELLRRLFTADAPNPTMATVLKIVTALDCKLSLQSAHETERGTRAKNSATRTRTRS